MLVKPPNEPRLVSRTLRASKSNPLFGEHLYVFFSVILYFCIFLLLKIVHTKMTIVLKHAGKPPNKPNLISRTLRALKSNPPIGEHLYVFFSVFLYFFFENYSY